METKDETLQRLILDPVPAATPAGPAAIVVEAPPKPAKPRAPRRAAPAIPDGLVDLVVLAIALVGVLIVAGVLWWIGASFTLAFLHGQTASLSRLGLGQWAIPVIITAVELALWPRLSSAVARWVIWLAFLAFDLGTSSAGFTDWGAGRTVPLFGGITFPAGGWWLWVQGLAIGMLLAFGPERMARYALGELRKVGAQLRTIWHERSFA